MSPALCTTDCDIPPHIRAGHFLQEVYHDIEVNMDMCLRYSSGGMYALFMESPVKGCSFRESGPILDIVPTSDLLYLPQAPNAPFVVHVI